VRIQPRSGAMQTIHFYGRILPSHIHTSTSLPEVKWKWEEEDVDLTFRTKTENATVEVECDIDLYKEEYLSELFKRATDMARLAVNLAAFTSGYGLTVTLETMLAPAGIRVLHRQETVSPSSTTAFGATGMDPQETGKVFALMIQEPSAFIALDDLIKAVTSTHTALADCGRVVDRIRRVIAPGLPDKAAWREMQRALNVERSYLQWISQQSTGSRHGDPTYIPGNVSSDAMRRTWEIMNRFMEYRKRGNQALTAPDFALLV
jgi:hypothetical protein